MSSAAELDGRVAEVRAALQQARAEIGKRVVGQDEVVDGMLMALVAGGHVLLEGAPGLAKTRAVRALAEVVDASYSRI